MLLEMRREKNEAAHTAFLDLERAFFAWCRTNLADVRLDAMVPQRFTSNGLTWCGNISPAE